MIVACRSMPIDEISRVRNVNTVCYRSFNIYRSRLSIASKTIICPAISVQQAIFINGHVTLSIDTSRLINR